uniref:Uncharacterized protein n=1 Tax=Cucumis melo TaxID=3656 RepID=A0A9I9EGM2_CUCME
MRGLEDPVEPPSLARIGSWLKKIELEVGQRSPPPPYDLSQPRRAHVPGRQRTLFHHRDIIELYYRRHHFGHQQEGTIFRKLHRNPAC